MGHPERPTKCLISSFNILQKLLQGWDQTGAPYVPYPIPRLCTRIDFKLTQSIAIIFDSELIDKLTYMVPCTSQIKVIRVVWYSLRGCTSDRMMIAVQYQIQKGLNEMNTEHIRMGLRSEWQRNT